MQRQQLALDVLRLFRGQVELQLVRLPRTLSGQQCLPHLFHALWTVHDECCV